MGICPTGPPPAPISGPPSPAGIGFAHLRCARLVPTAAVSKAVRGSILRWQERAGSGTASVIASVGALPLAGRAEAPGVRDHLGPDALDLLFQFGD